MKNQKFVSIVLSVVVSFLGVAALAYGVTTISTSIVTGGDVSMATASSTSQVKLDNLVVGQVSLGTTISSAGAIFASSTLKVYGASTLVGAVGITGLTTMVNATTTGNASIAGTFWVNGNATTTSAGNISTEGTLTASTKIGAASTTPFAQLGVGTGGVAATSTISTGRFCMYAGTVNGTMIYLTLGDRQPNNQPFATSTVSCF